MARHALHCSDASHDRYRRDFFAPKHQSDQPRKQKIDRKALNLKNYSHSHPTMYLPMHKQQNTLTAQSRPISAMTNKDIGRSPKKFLGRLNSPIISRHSADSSPAALRQYHGISPTALRQLSGNITAFRRQFRNVTK